VTGRWDRARLERVLGNLLSNAIKYSPRGGDIVVRIWIDENEQTSWANLAVQDHGAGIPAADLPRLFHWFYRGKNVANEVPGAGIGLAGARQIVELHGGTMQVDSQEGVGSTFTVRLSLLPQTELSHSQSEDLDRIGPTE
jgi:signal transduction histidine kinase